MNHYWGDTSTGIIHEIRKHRLCKIPPECYLVCNDENETRLLWNVLSPHAILTCSQKLPEFKILLQGGIYDIVLCEWTFGQGTWKEVLKTVKEFHPELPVVILAKTTENHDRGDVLKAGAIDLLVQPYRQQALLAVLEQAKTFRETRKSPRSLPSRGSHLKTPAGGKGNFSDGKGKFSGNGAGSRRSN